MSEVYMPTNKVMAYSAYTRALNKLINNDEVGAREELAKIKKAWSESGININIDESIEKMKAEIRRLDRIGLIESAPLASKVTRNDLASNPYVDNEYKTTSKPLPPRSQFPRVASAPELSQMFRVDLGFEFDKKSELGSGTTSLSDFTDDEIYSGATALPVSDIEGGNVTMSYNNVAYGGYAPNLAISFNSPLSKMHNQKERIKQIQQYLNNQSMQVDNIAQITPLELIKAVAKSINSQANLSPKEKEEKLENVAKRLTQLLLNETDVSQDYMLSTDERIRGRNYGHVGATGGLINSLFSNVAVHDNTQMHGTISTNTLVKAGTADCRATNATYASLLNVGYQEIGSSKEAKILYTKMAHGTSKESFAECYPEDHNIVLIKQANGQVTVMDAYFDHVNGTPLRQAIEGTSKQGGLKTDENEVGDLRTWGFQIPGIPPYPSQQQLKAQPKQTQQISSQGVVSDSAQAAPDTRGNDKENANPNINADASSKPTSLKRGVFSQFSSGSATSLGSNAKQTGNIKQAEQSFEQQREVKKDNKNSVQNPEERTKLKR